MLHLEQSASLPLADSTTDDLGFLFTFKQIRLSSKPNTAVFAGITSTSYILVFSLKNARTLSLLEAKRSGHAGATCLDARLEDGLLLTAGRDGKVKVWQAEKLTVVWETALSCSSPVSALAFAPHPGGPIEFAVGTQSPLEGEQCGKVYVWHKNHKEPVGYLESHSDTITMLQFADPDTRLLLSGSEDGLVTTFDTRDPEEDTAVQDVINTSSPIHLFLAPPVDVFASARGIQCRRACVTTSADERLSFHSIDEPIADAGESDTAIVVAGNKKLSAAGDLRATVGCDYVLKLFAEIAGLSAAAPAMAVGTHKGDSPRIDLIDLVAFAALSVEYSNQTEASAAMDVSSCTLLRLEQAHGEEIVRDLWVDVSGGVAVTCGEDGVVRAWQVKEGQRGVKRGWED